MKKRNRSISGILVLMLLAGFAACILAVLLSGADVYQNLTRRDQASYERRTAAQYITTKVRQYDGDGMLFVGTFEEERPGEQGNTLFLAETVDGENCYTRLYCYDGYIRELFAPPGGGFSGADGEKILPAKRVEFSVDGDLVNVELEYPDGTLERLVLIVRSGEVA